MNKRTIKKKKKNERGVRHARGSIGEKRRISEEEELTRAPLPYTTSLLTDLTDILLPLPRAFYKW